MALRRPAVLRSASSGVLRATGFSPMPDPYSHRHARPSPSSPRRSSSFCITHLYPVDVAELPDDRRPHGFDNLDFDFLRFGFRDRRCTALLTLPDYALAAIRTGQYVPGEGRLRERRVDSE